MQEVTALRVVFGVGMIFLLSIFPIVHCSEAAAQSNGMVGGPCEYRDYEGEAEVVSVTRTVGGEEGRRGEYEVKCCFNPREPIEEPFARTAAREFRILVENDENPGRCFVDRNDIRVGKRIPCVLRAIVRGTCTPVLYEFPWTRARGK